MTAVLTLVLLPFASLFWGSVLALRDGGAVVWEWVRVLFLASMFLGLLITLPEHAPMALSIALGLIVVMQIAGFFAWRLFGAGVPVDDQ